MDYMNMKDNKLKKEPLKLQSLKSCYLYISTSDSMLNDKVEGIREFLKGKINFDTDFKIFDGSGDIDEEEFNNYTGTPSLFSSKKVVVVKYADKVSARLQRKIIDLISVSRDCGANIIFVLTASKQKFNSNLVNLIKKNGIARQLKVPAGSNLKNWLEERSKSDGIVFTEKAASLLVENVNLDLNLLKKEYEKLYDYVSSETKKVIDEDEIRFLVSRNYSLKIFDLVDYLGRRDKESSLKALRSILEERQNLIGLITLLHRMFKCFLYIKSGNSKSSVTSYIENNMKIPPYFVGKLVNKYIKLSDNYEQSEIIKVFGILNRYDIKIRTGATGSKHLVTRLISEIVDVNA